MTTDEIHLKDADEAWIEKYRAAVKEIPVEPSRSSLREALSSSCILALSSISRIFGRRPRANSQRSGQPSDIPSAQTHSPATIAAPANAESSPRAGSAPVPAEVLRAANTEVWREKPVA